MADRIGGTPGRGTIGGRRTGSPGQRASGGQGASRPAGEPEPAEGMPPGQETPGGGPAGAEALLPALAAGELAQMRAWVGLAADERRRRAVAAAAAHDGPALAALADAYLTLRGRAGARVSAHTRRAYRTGILALVADWRDQALLRPGHDAGAAWVRGLEAAGASPSTARVRLAGARLLYRALRWARATEADPFADAQAARDPTAPHEKRRPYAPEELAALLGVAGPRDAAMLLLGAHAGLRVAEACALDWADVDLAAGALTVAAGKGGKRRRVVASGSLRRALAALAALAGEGHPGTRAGVSGTRPGRVLPITEGVARERMAKLAARAGVPYRGYHALRHAAGTRAAKEGLGLEGIASFLGHSNVNTTRVYQHWADESVARTVGDW